MTYGSDDFLLSNTTARALYLGFAASCPVFDFHSHLSPKAIAEDARFETVTPLWLDSDHYKWRLMRANGVDERLITGDAPDRDKFIAWAETIEKAIGNPVYDWAHLELKTFFGITTTLLGRASASKIYDAANEKLKTERISARSVLVRMNVKTVCTTDDPLDDLAYHDSLARDNFSVTVLPTFRPDKALAIETPDCFSRYIDALSSAAGVTISSFDGLLEALDKRHAYFHTHGCRSADHGLSEFTYEKSLDSEVNAVFTAARSGRAPDEHGRNKYVTALLAELCRMNHKRGWVQQLHCGVIRNPSTRLFKTFGPDAGADCIGDFSWGTPLCRLLDTLDRSGSLARTVLFNVNPRDNELFASIAGSFQSGPEKGKLQLGPAWWFADHKHGIESNLATVATHGLIGRCIGMTTDSRSFLSFVRHDYFRRILCGWLGAAIERGEAPNDPGLMSAMIADICYGNAQRYFAT